MINIKNILVPIDFSTTARNAYQYAKKLAEVLNASVTLINIEEYYMPISEIPFEAFPENENYITEEMENFIKDENTSNDWIMLNHKLKNKTLKGDLTGAIIALSDENSTDLIVIGTTGLQDFLSKITGSISLTVASKAHCPVILVPHLAKWHNINKIMYASNYDSTSSKMIKEIIDFSLFLNAKVDFVHVEDFSSKEEIRKTAIMKEELFELTDHIASLQVHSIYGEDKIEGLKEYAAHNNVDLMAFASKRRGFWDNFTHKSVTEHIALSTEKPMMLLHLNNELE